MLGDLVEDEDDEDPFKDEVFDFVFSFLGEHQGVLMQKLYSHHEPEPEPEHDFEIFIFVFFGLWTFM